MDDEVKELLLNKHPRANSADYDCILSGPEEKVEEVIFESIDSDLVYKTAKMINGSGGPTLIDSECWKHLLCSNNFIVQQKNLCDAIAKLAQQICVTQINSADFKELFACRLIPLDKCSGVRPMGIGEVLQRIIGKCVMKTPKVDVEESAGNIQTCGGQQAGIEAAIHAMQEVYNKNGSGALLLVDAINAFNSLNWQVAVGNVKILCPNIAQYIENTYKQPSRLYITGGNGEFILSEEGTAQGDNCAMAFYVISTVPILKHLHDSTLCDSVWQAWFADDSSATGNFTGIHKWWKNLLEIGAKYGYNPNPGKCVLMVKNEEKLNEAQKLFGDYGMEITRGKRHLGAVVGSFKTEYIWDKMKGWVEDIKILALIAKDDLQSAYAAMVFSIQHRWRYIQRTVPNISALFKDLENEIHHTLLPAILGRKISSEEKDIIALPVRYGGMGIPKPEEWSDFEFEASKKVTEKLKAIIIRQDFDTNINATEIVAVKREVKHEKEMLWKTKYESIHAGLNTSTKWALDNAQQKAASSWLTSLPITWLGFVLNKQEFKDSISLRCNWHIDNVPNYCGCGSANDIDHCLTCRRGGYVVMRHNQIRDTITNVMKEVRHDVQVEPHWIPTEGESLINPNASAEANARLDVSGRGVWVHLIAPSLI